MTATTTPPPPADAEPETSSEDIAGIAGRYASDQHDTSNAAVLGVALGVSFTVCFATGVLSHLIQNPASWFEWLARPAGLFRVTQGLHVATGMAAIPLLVAKLWTVAPQFWAKPPVRNVAHAIERAMIFPLVGGSAFLLVTGTWNTFHWRPWDFGFVEAHFWAAWITIGALIAHIGAKAGVTWSTLRPGYAYEGVSGRLPLRRHVPALDRPPPRGQPDRDHIKHLHRKLGCATAVDAIVTAYRLGLLPNLNVPVS